MATSISFVQAMPQTAAAYPPDGQAGDCGENLSGETFLSALRTLLAGEEGGGEKAQGTENNGESGEENIKQKKKDEILCTVFLGQALTMLPDCDEGDTQPVSGSEDAAGTVLAMGGAERNAFIGMTEELSASMQTLRSPPYAEAQEPAVQGAQEVILPQPWPKDDPETADPAQAQADTQTVTGEQSGERTVPVTEAADAGSKDGKIRTERETFSAERITASAEKPFSVGQANSGKAHFQDGQTADEESETDDEPGHGEVADMVKNGVRAESANSTEAFSQTAKTDAASEPPETQEAYLQVSDRVMKEIKDGETSFVMKLHPEGLGEISVHLRNSEDGISIQLEASSEKTLRAIEQRSGELKAALEAHDVRVSELHLSAGEAKTSGFLNSFSMGRQDFGEHGTSESWHQGYFATAVSDQEQYAGQTIPEPAEYDDGGLNDRA